MQSDPIGLASGNLTGYDYANSDPLSLIDPNGLAACEVLFPDYPIDTGFGFSSTSLGGHGGVLTYDAKGSTRYYEYGRYAPSGTYVIGARRPEGEGNVRKVPMPDLKIDPKSGDPTAASLAALRDSLSRRAGHNTAVELVCHNEVDEKKVISFAEGFASNQSRPAYSWKPWSSNQCRDFSRNSIGAGR